MVPNSTDNNINGIVEVKNYYGHLTKNDKKILKAVFEDIREEEGIVKIRLGTQVITFIEAEEYSVEVLLDCKNTQHDDKQLMIENVLIKYSCT